MKQRCICNQLNGGHRIGESQPEGSATYICPYPIQPLMIDTHGKTTEKVLAIAREAAKERGTDHIVIATTTGSSAKEAAKAMKGSGLKIVAVTHSSGFRNPGEQELPGSLRKELEMGGMQVVTGTMPFHGINDTLRKRGYYSPTTAVADALRMLGQGTKVCVEIACMAVDAGAVHEGKDVIAVAGTHRGADTVLLIKSSCTRRFMDSRIREVIAKPKEW